MTRPRDLEIERDITRHAAKGVADPSRLIEHAESRAQSLSGEYVPDSSLVALGRDRPRDVREELADGRNHLVWLLQEEPESPVTWRRVRALTAICVAYAELCEDA